MFFLGGYPARKFSTEPYGSTIELCQLFVFKVEPYVIPVWSYMFQFETMQFQHETTWLLLKILVMPMLDHGSIRVRLSL